MIAKRLGAAAYGLGIVLALACNSVPDAGHASTARAEDPKPAQEKKEEKRTDEVRSVEKGDKAELGKLAPDFTLKDLDGKDVKLSDFKGKVVVLEWFSPTCPACKYAYDGGPLKEQTARLKGEGVVWLAVNSEAPDRKGAKVETNKEFAEKYGMKSPVLFDPKGDVGMAYGAKTTPHCYVIDAKGVLVYRGALDNAPGGNPEPKDAKLVNYVDEAVKAAKENKAVATAETKSYG